MPLICHVTRLLSLQTDKWLTSPHRALVQSTYHLLTHLLTPSPHGRGLTCVTLKRQGGVLTPSKYLGMDLIWRLSLQGQST